MDSQKMNVRAMEMARTRQRLAVDPLARRQAICYFPITVFHVADDMRKILQSIDFEKGISPEVEEGLKFLEDAIREAYRYHFGAELGQ